MIPGREFITLLVGAAAWPLAARAQQGDRVRRIGVLMARNENDPVAKSEVSAFTQALAVLGWSDGRNVRMDLRWAGADINRIRALVAELVGLQPDIILTISTPATVALQRETRTIAIVVAGLTDPVAQRIVARLDRPSGNITGFAIFEATLGGKWLELLSEIAPGLMRAAIMFNPDSGPYSILMASFEAAARSLKIVAITAPVHDDGEIETAITALGREPGGGLVVPGDAFMLGIARRSYRRRPETMYRRSIRHLSLPETAACSPTDPTKQTACVVPPLMWIASCAARSRAISRCSCRPSSRWPSTARPPRRSVLPYPHRFCCARTR
jgi:putative ABC transport system substrate-binding protein